MKLTCNSFFDGAFEYLNLNDFFRSIGIIRNSRDPSQIQAALDGLGKLTYGGYGEDRKDVWKGTYMDTKQNYIHLGIDIMVPYGTPIKCPLEVKVVDVFSDIDTHIGWGGRVILRKYNGPYLILAHIAPESLSKSPVYKQGDIIGVVGTWPTNGNTFHHLHVQVVYDLDCFDDGYGYVSDLVNNPDPFSVEF